MSKYFAGKQKITNADHSKYVAMSYELEGSPNVSGSTATANVKMKTQDGKELGTKEWTFEKEADKWKIKSAPKP